jgi:hypothetical protein
VLHRCALALEDHDSFRNLSELDGPDEPRRPHERAHHIHASSMPASPVEADQAMLSAMVRQVMQVCVCVCVCVRACVRACVHYESERKREIPMHACTHVYTHV